MRIGISAWTWLSLASMTVIESLAALETKIYILGGWKGSGTSGKAGGGHYYVQQYLREQSQTVIEE